MNIVCYVGGTCGDLVAALFDPTSAELGGNLIKLPDERSRLKKPHLFLSDSEKDQYLDSLGDYPSITSHDTSYHISRCHHFITIISDNMTTNMWAAQRFKDLHRPHVWEEMSAYSGTKTIAEYAQMIADYSKMVVQHTDKTILLDDIVNGKLLTTISAYTNITPAAEGLYQSWLEAQRA